MGIIAPEHYFIDVLRDIDNLKELEQKEANAAWVALAQLLKKARRLMNRLIKDSNSDSEEVKTVMFERLKR